ncbi:MAG: tetratricopeptide repeat protein [Candidatus Hermodarchaeota archaeon]
MNIPKKEEKKEEEVEIKVEDYNKYFHQAVKYSFSKNYDKTIESWTKVLTINPKYDTGWIMLGKTYEKMGNYQEALKYYDKALEITPTHPKAHQYKEELLKKKVKA